MERGSRHDEDDKHGEMAATMAQPPPRILCGGGVFFFGLINVLQFVLPLVFVWVYLVIVWCPLNI